MKAPKLGLAVAVAAAMVLTACSSGTDSDSGGGDGSSSDNADMKICMYTHGDGGGFWSVAKKGAEKAADDLGVDLDYQESNNDPEAQAQFIEAGVDAGCDGIAVSAPNPDAIQGAMDKANEAGIPLVTMNSGSDVVPGPARLHPRRPGRVHRRPGGRREVQGARRDQGAVPDPGGQQHRPAAAL